MEPSGLRSPPDILAYFPSIVGFTRSPLSLWLGPGCGACAGFRPYSPPRWDLRAIYCCSANADFSAGRACSFFIDALRLLWDGVRSAALPCPSGVIRVSGRVTRFPLYHECRTTRVQMATGFTQLHRVHRAGFVHSR